MSTMLNVGNCWNQYYLERLIQLNDTIGVMNDVKITSIFGSLSFLTPSARSADRLPEFEIADLGSYISMAQTHGIAVRYTLNQSCIGPMQEFKVWWQELEKSIKVLKKEGVYQYTITSPLLLELVREMYGDSAYLEVSTICEVDSIRKLDYWRKLGANGVCLKLDINRDFQTLQSISTYCRDHGMGLSR